MGWITQARRRQINAKGRPMVIRRPGQTAGVTMQAYAPPAQASQIIDADFSHLRQFRVIL